MKEDLNYFQSRNTKTECSTLVLMGLATIIHPQGEKFFAER